MTLSIDVTAWREFLRTLDGLVLVAFLKAVSHELHHREMHTWRAVSDAADELHDTIQLAARRAAENLLERGRPPSAEDRPRKVS